MAHFVRSATHMGHPLRLYEPNRVYEITTRTIQGRFLLRPSEELNEIITGIIGRAQYLYPDVEVHGSQFLSTHGTWLVSSANPQQISDFMGYVNGNISRELTKLVDWPGKAWDRRYRPIPVLDEAAMIDRMEHLLAQGCKDEHLVESPRDWPGVTCVFALLGEKELRGYWFDRDLENQARRRGKQFGKYEFATPYTVRFSKLPCWAHLSDEEYTERVGELVFHIENKYQQERSREGRKVLGARAVCAMHPHHRPASVAKSPAPQCHASIRATRVAFRRLFRAFVDAYRQAAKELKAGRESVVFPLYCFPPRRPFVASTA